MAKQSEIQKELVRKAEELLLFSVDNDFEMKILSLFKINRNH
jgi:hypothetical protein